DPHRGRASTEHDHAGEPHLRHGCRPHRGNRNLRSVDGHERILRPACRRPTRMTLHMPTPFPFLPSTHAKASIRLARRLPAAVALCAWLAASSHAQTLQEAMAHAYGSHPALGAQRANVRALDQDVDSARAGWRPTVSVS